MNNSRQYLLGKSGRPYLTYLEELRYRRPHLALTECTVAQDVAYVTKKVGDIYIVHSILLSPGQLGRWVDRRRRFCILILRDSPLLSGTRNTA